MSKHDQLRVGAVVHHDAHVVLQPGKVSGPAARGRGVKIRFAEGFGLDVANSRLAIEVASSAGVHNAAFDLEQTGLQPVQLPGGLFSSPQPGVGYQLRLTAQSKNKFRELQAFVARAKVEDIAIRVMPKLGAKPDGATSVVVWIDLRLTEEEGYFALVKAAQITLAK